MNHCILGIESSCDETAAAVYTTGEGIGSNELFSQIAVQAHFGGVVPELASQYHLEYIRPIVAQALSKAHKTLDDITAIAVTYTPGLPGSLLVGINFAKGIGWPTQKKIIGINHLEGHIFSACIERPIPFPFLCITASGGHTSLYMVENYGVYTLLGHTLDDAAGEAFDKVGRLIGLPYPAGALIEKLAQEAGFLDYFQYPRPLPHSLNFSFSGLKTAVLYDLIKQGAYDPGKKLFLKEHDPIFKQRVASSLLVCITDCFEQKLKLAFKTYPVQAVAFVGGVACNRYIKKRLEELCIRSHKQFFYPSPAYCTDNGAMIAFVGHYKAQQEQWSDYTLDILG